MNIELGLGDEDEVDDKIGQLELDLADIEESKPPHRVDFKGKNDDPPEDGGEGVREPRRPGPNRNLGGAALTLPVDF